MRLSNVYLHKMQLHLTVISQLSKLLCLFWGEGAVGGVKEVNEEQKDICNAFNNQDKF